jgi:dTDP-4-dehydrorhamnose 3,5-epimerase
MKVSQTPLSGLLLIEADIYRDDRGAFQEVWNRRRYAENGLDAVFVQDNISYSKPGVLRGLHYQHPAGQGKLVSALVGEVFDVAVDIRVGSPTFGRWFGTHLSSENGLQVFIPTGFAHGFIVLGAEGAWFSYKCTEYYQPKDEGTILWSDPDLAIAWPLAEPILNAKDRDALRLRDVSPDRLPRFEPPEPT